MKRISVLLLAFLLTLVVGGAAMADSLEASHNLTVTIPSVTKVELEEADETISFGTINTAGKYTGKLGEKDSFTVTYRCNKKGSWELKVSAGQFVGTAGEVLPATALNLYFGGTKYNILNTDATGGVSVDSDLSSGAATQSVELGYELEISESDFDQAYAGDYSNTVTYTLFVY